MTEHVHNQTMGYTNYETALLSMELNNDRPQYEALQRLARIDREEMHVREKWLREFVEEYHHITDEGLAGSLLNNALDRVNWKELIEEALQP